MVFGHRHFHAILRLLRWHHSVTNILIFTAPLSYAREEALRGRSALLVSSLKRNLLHLTFSFQQSIKPSVFETHLNVPALPHHDAYVREV